MDQSAKLAELRETLARREDMLKVLHDPHDRRVVEADMAEIKRDIAELEKQDTAFSSGPCGGA